jgi:hypothetical protein
MTVTFTGVSLCGGGNHVTLSLTQDGEARTIHLDTSELRHDMTTREIIKTLGLKEDRDIDAMYLVYQALKQANADTQLKKRNAILSIQDATLQAARV